MSDFYSNFWPIAITVVVVLGLLACLLGLFLTSRRRVATSADASTGHVWDGDLRELNNPLPRWWMGLFVLTVLSAAIYLYFYPGLGSYKGASGWTSKGVLDTETDQYNQNVKAVYAKYADMKVEDIAKDPAARGMGQRLFLNNCAACHGSDARGSKSFPNLTDTDWLGGKDWIAGQSTAEYIVRTITHGRQGEMPSQAAALGSAEDVKNVANYVLSLSGSAHNNVAAELGRPKFAVCATCHGADGKGNQTIGAPNLTDKVWLHGWGEKAVTDMINNGKVNVMPAFGQRLAPEQIRVLASYVWSLSEDSRKQTPAQ